MHSRLGEVGSFSAQKTQKGMSERGLLLAHLSCQKAQMDNSDSLVLHHFLNKVDRKIPVTQ